MMGLGIFSLALLTLLCVSASMTFIGMSVAFTSENTHVVEIACFMCLVGVGAMGVVIVAIILLGGL